MKKRILSLILVCVLMIIAIPVQGQGYMQSYINLMMGSDQSSLNVTWYSDTDGSASVVYCKAVYVKNGVMSEDKIMTSTATTNLADEGEEYYNHMTTISGLEPSTEYAYSLENNGYYGEVSYFTTGDSDEYGFALVADAQLGSGDLEEDIAAWQHTLGLIENDDAFEPADFLLSLGDQVDDCGSETHFDAFLNQDLITRMPIATTIGNHETDAPLYSYHFNPANSSDKYGITTAGSDSWFRYNDTLFVVFNTSAGGYDDHRGLVDEAVRVNPDVRWKVAVFHHSIYTVSERAEESSTLSRREWMTTLLKEYDFDIALSGHDHIYSRSYLMDGTLELTDSKYYDNESLSSATDTDAIPYFTFNSATGSKYYDVVSPDQDEIFIYNQEYTPNLSMVSVTNTSFTVTTYRTKDMSVVDSFTINKTPEKAFTDVTKDHWYYDAVKYVCSKGLMLGMSDTVFAPNMVTDRAMPVTVLWRFEGSPEGFSHSFTDVEPEHYADKAIAWAYSNGIIEGVSHNRYAPNEKLSREQLAAILFRYAAYSGKDTDARGDLAVFADCDRVDLYAEDAMEWAYGEEIITGINEITLDPDGNATRAQLATILMRFLG